MPSEAAPISSAPKLNAKVALISLPEPYSAILRSCFREFSIQAIMLSGIGMERLKTERFDGCVLRLSEETEPLVGALRASPLNMRTVVYGICGGTGELLRFSKHGINALLSEPLAKEAVMEAIRGTHRLVRGELRCYVRVPLVAEVLVTVEGKTLSALSQEISVGGMSLMVPADLPLNQALQLSFSLPSTPKIALRAVVCWTQSAQGLGVRFDRSNERDTVRKWIGDYLDIG